MLGLRQLATHRSPLKPWFACTRLSTHLCEGTPGPRSVSSHTEEPCRVLGVRGEGPEGCRKD